VKDSSQYEERREGELIKKATNESVRNVARYSYHETMQIDEKNDDTSKNVRQGLMKKCGRTAFKEKCFINSEAPVPESSRQALAHQTQSRSTSRKRSSSSTREHLYQQSDLAQAFDQSIQRSLSTIASIAVSSPGILGSPSTKYLLG